MRNEISRTINALFLQDYASRYPSQEIRSWVSEQGGHARLFLQLASEVRMRAIAGNTAVDGVLKYFEVPAQIVPEWPVADAPLVDVLTPAPGRLFETTSPLVARSAPDVWIDAAGRTYVRDPHFSAGTQLHPAGQPCTSCKDKVVVQPLRSQDK